MTSERKMNGVLADAPTRRQVISGGAVAVAGLVLGSVRAGAQQTMTEPQSTGPDKAKTYLHQEVDFKASPHRIYDILLDSKQFSALSGEPATIIPEVGGAFAMFGGKIVDETLNWYPTSELCRRGVRPAGNRGLIRWSSLN